jgi:hypothetical protein
MSGARIFAHNGFNVWPGGAPLVPAELLDLPACRVIHDATRAWDGTVDAVVVLGDADELPPPRPCACCRRPRPRRSRRCSWIH